MTPVTLTANERRRVEGAGFGNGVLGEAAGACCMLLVFTKQLLIGIDTGGCLRSVRNLGCLPQSAEFPPPPPFFLPPRFVPGVQSVPSSADRRTFQPPPFATVRTGPGALVCD